MAKRRGNSGASVNLFPFLSILVCIIGCLTLIIVVINLIAMNKGEGKTEEEITIAQEYMLIKKEKEEEQEELENLKVQVENLIQQSKDAIAQRDKLAMLKDMLENAEEIDENRNALIAEFNRLTGVNEKLTADHTSLLEAIKEKEAEIAKRKLPPEEAQLRVRPSGSGSQTRPHFVEVSSKAIYIHTSLTKEPEAIPIASMAEGSFPQLLKKIASQPYNRLIFLVRGDKESVQVLNQAKGLVNSFNQANKTEIIPGRLPLPGKGKIDLQMFADYLEP